MHTIEFVKLSLIGLITGILNGLFGSGGGTIVVPALNLIMKAEVHKCHATAIAVILPLTVVSSFIYIFNGITDWPLTIKVGLGSVVGGCIGALLLNKIKSTLLKKLFGIFMIAAAVRMWFN
ncbi:sulfite exporter TauE/SafE family protein [Calorimonas adulescens]|jgi:Sulfite exporter TauE/SafE.|uniref:Probable membrane transporter protein n=1 Tax=Calorimonas adulescens TaxID=2606906 RepID=A0A5D8QJW0_9THEO|nr:sulfite exporter TauE/SafE family protein [Calorimonas adulescens]TZE83588.1 sulfite exporter TauE/SafE family protein [Calorimonas adulescens]